jgi:hypothetical protein
MIALGDADLHWDVGRVVMPEWNLGTFAYNIGTLRRFDSIEQRKPKRIRRRLLVPVRR